MLGNHINDIVILQLGGVSKSLWKVKDYALELIVLKLASAGTSKKLLNLPNEDSGYISVLCLPIYHLRLILYAVKLIK